MTKNLVTALYSNHTRHGVSITNHHHPNRAAFATPIQRWVDRVKCKLSRLLPSYRWSGSKHINLTFVFPPEVETCSLVSVDILQPCKSEEHNAQYAEMASVGDKTAERLAAAPRFLVNESYTLWFEYCEQRIKIPEECYWLFTASMQTLGTGMSSLGGWCRAFGKLLARRSGKTDNFWAESAAAAGRDE